MTWEGADAGTWQERWRLPLLHMFPQTSSTNTVVKELAEEGAPAGTMALAEVQTSGRGRRDKRWDAAPGTSLLFSVLLRPAEAAPAEHAGTIPLRVGMAVARAIERATGVTALLKWPNDILARDRRKLAGILCESSLGAHGLTWTVAGVGINVLQQSSDFSDDVREGAASLAMLENRVVARAELMTAIVDELRPLFAHSAAPLGEVEQMEYARRDALLGRIILVDGERVGTAVGVGPAGDLRVSQDRRGAPPADEAPWPQPEEHSFVSGTVRIAS